MNWNKGNNMAWQRYGIHGWMNESMFVLLKSLLWDCRGWYRSTRSLRRWVVALHRGTLTGLVPFCGSSNYPSAISSPRKYSLSALPITRTSWYKASNQRLQSGWIMCRYATRSWYQPRLMNRSSIYFRGFWFFPREDFAVSPCNDALIKSCCSNGLNCQHAIILFKCLDRLDQKLFETQFRCSENRCDRNSHFSS